MTAVSASISETPRATRETIGRVVAVSGGMVTVGMIIDNSEQPARDRYPNCRSTAQIDIVGEIKASASGAAYFQRGITEYPTIGDRAVLMSERELRLIYSGRGGRPLNVGVLQQNPAIATPIDIEHLVQTLCRARHHRHPQIHRCGDAVAADAGRTAGSPHLPDRSAQRIQPVLRANFCSRPHSMLASLACAPE